MDTKKLRQKILDLAIRGKLVPQDPNDEPASVLLERIRAEKEQLIKEGKIKRSKKSVASDISHYENVPFEVPEGWCWTTIEDLLINRDSERIPLSLAVRNKQHKKEYNYYGAAGVIDKVEGYLFSERLLLIGEDGANLLSRAKDNAFFADGKYWVNNHAHVLDCSEKEVLTYVALVINSMALDPYVTGSAQPKLSQDNLNKILIPLPPLAEQRRIIYAINNYSGYLSNIENDKESIEHIIDLLKQLILNLAITGKLVSQELNDEPAIELLKRIYPSFVPADNRHYKNLPETWEEVELGAICQLFDGKKVTDKELVNLDVKYLRGSKEGDKLFSGKYVRKDALMILVDGENSGEVFITPHEGYQGSTFKQLRISSELNRDYVLSLIQHSRELLKDNKVGSAIPHLNKKLFKQIHVPIPPYNEQERIVQTVQTIMFKLDEILANL